MPGIVALFAAAFAFLMVCDAMSVYSMKRNGMDIKYFEFSIKR